MESWSPGVLESWSYLGPGLTLDCETKHLLNSSRLVLSHTQIPGHVRGLDTEDLRTKTRGQRSEVRVQFICSSNQIKPHFTSCLSFHLKGQRSKVKS